MQLFSKLYAPQYKYLEDKGSVALPTLTQYQSVSTFESEVRNLLSAHEPSSTGSLGHQYRAKKTKSQ